MRVARGIFDDAADAIKGCDDMWCPFEDTQVGTKWLPLTIFGVTVSGSKETGGEAVEQLWILFIVQLAISLLPSIVACWSRCTGDEANANKKAAMSGSSNSLTAFLVGIFGILAIKLDCRELLQASTITALLGAVLLVVYFLIMLCGLCGVCRASDGCADAFCSLIVFIIAAMWTVASGVINIFIVYTAWPFCFGESVEDTIGNIQN